MLRNLDEIRGDLLQEENEERRQTLMKYFYEKSIEMAEKFAREY